ncbi:MAG: ATP-binding protein [Bacteroidota bacterium]|nr:ATP-binding protein [Bacteroidota bacterium]
MKTEDNDFKLIFESVPGLFLVLDPAFKIFAASNAYLDASMTAREKVEGRIVFEVFPDNPEDANANGVAMLKRSLEKVLENKVPHTMDILQHDVRRPDGTFEERTWKPFNSPVLDEAGEVRFIIHRVEDVTALAQLEKALSIREELTENEKESHFLIEKNLEKRAKDLQESNLELERFAYVASHDLQEPLRMVTSFLDLLKKKYHGQLDATADQYIYYAVDGAERMKILILNLLDYSKIGFSNEGFETTDLNRLLNYVAMLFREDLNSTGGALVIGKLPAVAGRKAQLAQLFQNVISNAIKYRSAAPLRMEIGCTEKAGEYEFFVADNGIGIHENSREKVFLIFQRLHTRSEYAGTGIGLSICRKIVEVHGGKMWVEPSLQGGSTFRFTIPKNPNL